MLINRPLDNIRPLDSQTTDSLILTDNIRVKLTLPYAIITKVCIQIIK